MKSVRVLVHMMRATAEGEDYNMYCTLLNVHMLSPGYSVMDTPQVRISHCSDNMQSDQSADTGCR
jgi:hypothetical protein